MPLRTAMPVRTRPSGVRVAPSSTPRRPSSTIIASVLRQLDIFDTLQARFRTYPSGAIAMRELAASDATRPIGCTQVSEILYTEGVELVGPLPDRFELATVYSCALAARAGGPTAEAAVGASPAAHLAAHLCALLGGEASRALRERGGFEL